MTTYAILLLTSSPVGIMALLWGIARYERALLRAKSLDELPTSMALPGPHDPPDRLVGKPSPAASDV